MPYIIDSVTIEVYKETYEDGKGRRLEDECRSEHSFSFDLRTQFDSVVKALEAIRDEIDIAPESLFVKVSDSGEVSFVEEFVGDELGNRIEDGTPYSENWRRYVVEVVLKRIEVFELDWLAFARGLKMDIPISLFGKGEKSSPDLTAKEF